VPADDAATHETEIWQVEGIKDLGRAGGSRFLRRHRLAGQRRLIDKEVLGADEPQIRRDHVAGGETHDIARNQPLDRNFGETVGLILAGAHLRAAPLDPGRRLHHGAQFRCGIVGTMLLDERRGDREDDHDRDNDSRPDIAKKIGNRREREQQRVQGVFGAPPQFSQNARAAFLGNKVWSDGRQSCVRFGGVQPLRRSSKSRTD
jgi:hypothetical protein